MGTLHHPHFSATVFRRRAVEQMLDLLVGGLEMSTQGAHFLSRSCYTSNAAYYSALRRLEKKGLIVRYHGKRRERVIALTPQGKSATSIVCRKKEPWPRKWNGIWYLLTYDVPEANRSYRDTLRHFLKRMRMGGLQKSLWISPKDIRPEYDDLSEAINVDLHSFLFETRSVLGRPASEIVYRAWNWNRLNVGQEWYITTCNKKLEQLRSDLLSQEELCTLAREELALYTACMHDDPLLPRPLWPSDYRGYRAWQLHRRFVAELSHKM